MSGRNSGLLWYDARAMENADRAERTYANAAPTRKTVKKVPAAQPVKTEPIMTAVIPPYVKLKITSSDQVAYYSRATEEYLRKYFPVAEFEFRMNPDGFYGLQVYRKGGYSPLTANLGIDRFPSCCGWSIYNGFRGVDSLSYQAKQMQLSDDQLAAFRDALAFYLQAWGLHNFGPNAMAVFVSKDSDYTLSLSDVRVDNPVVNFQWALEAMLAVCPDTKVLDSRINRNSGKCINTVAFSKPTLESIHAAWN